MTNHYFKWIALAIICCIGSSMWAQTSVATYAQFDAALTSMKTTGNGGSIVLTNNFTVPIAVSTTYSLSSDAAHPIDINTGTYTISSSSSGTGTSDINQSILEVGANVTVHGSQTVLLATNKSIIRVITGGTVSSITTATNGANYAAISSGGGFVYVTGGTVSMDASSITSSNAFAIYIDNYMTLNITGGTISCKGRATRTIRVGTNSTASISGATINGAGVTGSVSYSVHSIGGSVVTIGDNTTITADANTTALCADGSTSALIISRTAANVTLTATTKYANANNGGVFDLRDLAFTANTVTNNTFPSPNTITITATGASAAQAAFYFDYTNSPTITSANIAQSGKITVANATTVIKIRLGRGNWIDDSGHETTLTYTVTTPSLATMISTFPQLQAAYTASQTAGSITQLMLAANIIINTNFTMKPADAAHAVLIDANNFYLSLEGTVELGGSLSISSTVTTSGNWILQTPKAVTTTISGGTYTVNSGKGIIILVPSGQSVNDATTILNLSNATFNANGSDATTSIVKYTTSNGCSFSATNCTFTSNAKSIAFKFIGPKTVNFTNCSLSIGSDTNSQAFSFLPTNTGFTACSQTFNGLALTMATGTVFTTGGTQPINTIIDDFTLNGSATAALTAPAGGSGAKKFYDFRAFTPTVSIPAGNYSSTQNVTLSLTSTAVSPIDATGATMVYSTDGTEPTAASTAYTTPIAISSSTILKMAALKDGFIGKSATFNYVLPTPAVTTQAATALSYSTATGNGTITLDGSDSSTKTRGFCWDISANPDPTIASSVTTETGTFTAGTFTGSITGLTPGTSYKVRAYVTNGSGTSYGATQTLVTLIPTITVSQTARSGFAYIYGAGPSAEQTFTVAGTNLSTDITVTPPNDYEISKTSATGFVSTALTFTQTSGTVATSTVYIRLKSGLPFGNYNTENIAIASSYIGTQNVACSGSVTTKTLTITGLTGVSKVVDGTNAATFTGTPAYAGLVNGETFSSVSGTPTATFADGTVANAKTITVAGYNPPSTNYIVTSPSLTANIYPLISTWNSTGAGDWSTSVNWTYLPLAATDVVVASGELVIDQTPTVNSITVNPGAKLTLNDGQTLNAGTLTLLSDPAGVISTATFVDKSSSPSPTPITATVQQYLAARRNWYISSPTSGATENVVLGTGNSLWQYNEINSDWTTSVDPSYSMLATYGFVAYSTAGSMLNFTGVLNSGGISTTLQRTENGNAERGYNLVGNPYPSYLDWNAVYNTSYNINPSMWYRTMKGSVYEFDTYSATDGLGTDNGTLVSQYIPPMQAFWILVSPAEDNSSTTGALFLQNAMRSHDATGTNLLKTKALVETTQPVLRLQVSNGTNSDEAIVLFNPNATNGYDKYDSPKMTNNNATIPEIYTIAGTKQVVINGMNSIAPNDELPLGFTTGQSNAFTIKATEISNFDEDAQIILKDNLLNTQQDLTANATYSFTSDVASTASRFSLIFKSPSVTTGLNHENSDKNILIYKNGNNQITIQCSGNLSEKSVVVVSNTIGQKLVSKQLTSSVTVIDSYLRSGVYLVTVTNAGKTSTQKVILN